MSSASSQAARRRGRSMDRLHVAPATKFAVPETSRPYMESHQRAIQQAVASALASITLTKPEDPIAALSVHFAQRSSREMQSAMPTAPQPIASAVDDKAKISRLEAAVAELTIANEAKASRIQVLESELRRVNGVQSDDPCTLRAIAAGVVAVGSEKGQAEYIPHMEQWSQDRSQLLPKQVILQANVAAIQALGPAFRQRQLEQRKIEELEKSLKALEGAELSQRTKLDHKIAEAKEQQWKHEEHLKAAVSRVDAIMLESAEAISPGLTRDAESYAAVIERLLNEEPGVLEELSAEAAAMVNVGVLEVAEEVEVVRDGKMRRAAVRRVVDPTEGIYEVSLWTEVSLIHQRYEAGFDTSKPELVTVARRDIYANTKHTQVLSAAARALWSMRASADASNSHSGSDAPPSTDPAYLALLYTDAERTLSHLHDMSAHIKKEVAAVEAIVAPLKGAPRAAHITLEKYGGDYRQLVDLARMTINCNTLKEVKAVLKTISATKGWEVLVIKNRLMLSFDASALGGYRDMLVNVRCLATGHVAEVQITLKALLDVKANGSHTNYAVARVHNLFEPKTYRYEGVLGEQVIKAVRCGVVRELVCRGVSAGLTPHFDGLLAALRSAACGVLELRLVGCDWPEGRELSELVDALPARGLKTLAVANMRVGGALPEVLFEKCAEAEVVMLYQLGLTGGMPASVGKCAKLKALVLKGNELEGCIPDEIGKCVELEVLELNQNKLSVAGGVPASLDSCTKLRLLNC